MPAPKRPTRLRALKVNEVSLVDRPANQHARVLLAKSEDGTDDELEKLEAAFNSEDDAESVLTKIAHILGFKKRKPPTPGEEPMKCPCGSGKEVAKGEKCPSCGKVMKADGTVETPAAVEEVIKSLPADAQALIVKAQADAAAAASAAADTLTVVKGLTEELKKLREERQDSESVTLAKSMVGVVGVKPEDLAHVLKQLDEKGRGTVTELLAKHNSVLKSSGLFREFGTANGKSITKNSEAEDKFKAAAAVIKAAEPRLSEQQIAKRVYDANPDLYEALS